MTSSLPDLENAKALLKQANALRDQRSPGSKEIYAQALDAIESATGNEADNLKANIWTNRGIALLEEGTPDALTEAVSCFDQAIQLRQTLPLNVSPLYPWGLAAAWMNRADALTRLDLVKNNAEALRSYDEGLAVLSQMRPGDHPSLQSRIALAWMNRGLVCQDADPTEGLRCLNTAETTCDLITEPGAAECKRVLIGVILNRAVLQVSINPQAAWADARKTSELTADLERRELPAADASLRARHLLCHVLTHLPVEEAGDWVTEATDAVDDGMALARHWVGHDHGILQPLAQELFRFGLKVYQIWQPHFLAEFILDNLDPDHSPGAPVKNQAMHHMAVDAIWNAVVAINARVKQSDIPDEERASLLIKLQSLQAADQRLTSLREEHFKKAV